MFLIRSLKLLSLLIQFVIKDGGPKFVSTCVYNFDVVGHMHFTEIKV